MTTDSHGITQHDIDNNMSNVVLTNYAPAANGIAMCGQIETEIDGEMATLVIRFEILNGEEQDNEDIYTIDRIIDVDRVD